MEHRIKGEYGKENITVFTEWLDCKNVEAMGIMLGLEISGWENCEIEKREE